MRELDLAVYRHFTALLNEAVVEKFVARIVPDQATGCWLWTGTLDRDGYGRITIARKSVETHRVSWRLAKGDIPAGMCVCHSCDVRSCVNPHHLWIGTNAENTADRVKKGRGILGTRNHKAKLTPDKVLEIFNSKNSNHVLSRQYGVVRSVIGGIKRGEIWKSVTGASNERR